MRRWLRSVSALSSKARRQKRARALERLKARRLFLEALEDRRMMTTTVSLALVDGEALEGHASNRGLIEVSRQTDDASQPLSVGISFDTSTADSGDYVLEDLGGNVLSSQTVLTIPADETSLSVYVRALGDGSLEGNESLVISLIADMGEPPQFTLGTASQTVVLLDNAGPTAQADAYSVDEDSPL